MYKLKAGQESFTPVEGPFEKRTFSPGKSYSEIPPGEKRRFEEIKETPAFEIAKPAKTGKKGFADPAPEGEVKS